MARQATVEQIINRTALEVGLTPQADPVSSVDEAFVQLVGLLNVAGQELVELYEWQTLQKLTTFTTDGGYQYELPDDFAYIVNQTMWNRNSSLPIGGPLSSQDWAYLTATDEAGSTINLNMRIIDNDLYLYPTTIASGITVSYEYISRYWIRTVSSSVGDADEIQSSTDVVLFDPVVVQKFLKCKWLEAKGFDASAARLEFENMFLSRTGRGKGAPILNAGTSGRGIVYLDPVRNTSDSGYGL